MYNNYISAFIKYYYIYNTYGNTYGVTHISKLKVVNISCNIKDEKLSSVIKQSTKLYNNRTP